MAEIRYPGERKWSLSARTLGRVANLSKTRDLSIRVRHGLDVIMDSAFIAVYITHLS